MCFNMNVYSEMGMRYLFSGIYDPESKRKLILCSQFSDSHNRIVDWAEFDNGSKFLTIGYDGTETFQFQVAGCNVNKVKRLLNIMQSYYEA